MHVVERWRGTNDFAFFGKGAEVATNRLEDQDTAALALHLVQVSLVYVNTSMLQGGLSNVAWRALMMTRDIAGLTPLVHAHVNSYGMSELDMSQRLDQLLQLDPN